MLLEDIGAEIGLFLALGGVLLAEVTGDPRWDAVGSVAIGVLLVVIAIVLAIEMKGLLIGESASAADVEQDRRRARGRTERRAGSSTCAPSTSGPTSSSSPPRSSSTRPQRPGHGRRHQRRQTRPAGGRADGRVIYLEPDLFRAPVSTRSDGSVGRADAVAVQRRRGPRSPGSARSRATRRRPGAVIGQTSLVTGVTRVAEQLADARRPAR